MNKLAIVGKACKRYRKQVLNLSVYEVARKTGYSVSNIYAFETGRVNNCLLLIWYMSKGFKLEDIKEG